MAEQISERQAAYLNDLLARADASWPQDRTQIDAYRLGRWFDSMHTIRPDILAAGYESVAEAIAPVVVADIEAWRAGLDVTALSRAQASTAIDALRRGGGLGELFVALTIGLPAQSTAWDKIARRREYLRSVAQRLQA
jgi:hypothetical protein